MLRRPTSRWPVLLVLAAAGVLAGLALAFILALPRLTTYAPTDGAHNVPGRLPIRLTFSRPMDHASVAQALRLTPAVAGSVSWEGNTLVYAPDQAWPEGTTVTVTLLGGGPRSLRGLPMWGETTWSFTVGGPRIAYLTGTTPNIWALPLAAGAQPQPITSEPYGVWDFALGPDGTRLVYAALRADRGADLRTVLTDGSEAADLLACPGEACLSPAFALDGRRVAYERHALVPGLTGQVTFGEPHVHVYTLATGAEVNVDASEPERQTRFPRWGADGRLGYYDALRRALVVEDLDGGGRTYIPNASGEMGTWSPDGQFIVYPEIFFPGEAGAPEAHAGDHVDQFFSQLLRVEIATNAAVDLSGSEVVEDASPVYAPSGEWLAFARKGLSPDQWTPGRQLWLMRADGSEARPLTDAPLYHHSAFAWGPDGQALVYMRFNAVDPSLPAEIWTIRADGSGARRLVSGGYLPAWLP